MCVQCVCLVRVFVSVSERECVRVCESGWLRVSAVRSSTYCRKSARTSCISVSRASTPPIRRRQVRPFPSLLSFFLSFFDQILIRVRRCCDKRRIVCVRCKRSSSSDTWKPSFRQSGVDAMSSRRLNATLNSVVDPVQPWYTPHSMAEPVCRPCVRVHPCVL